MVSRTRNQGVIMREKIPRGDKIPRTAIGPGSGDITSEMWWD